MNLSALQIFRNISAAIIGPDATKAELILGWGTAVVFCAGQLIWAQVWGNWTWWQLMIALVFAFDIGGGVVVNATRSGRKYWHRPTLNIRNHALFYLAHIHPFLIALFWNDFSWWQALAIYVGMLIMAFLVRITSPKIKRPLSFGLTSLATVAGITWLRMPAGIAWLPPLYFVKLILAHSVPEE
jgi:hypothetical protein